MLRDAYPSRYVGYDLTGACFRIEALVGIDAVLVLGEEDGTLELSDIMVEGSGPHQLGVGADGARRFGGEGGHLHGMLECAGASCARRRSRGLLISDSSTRVTVEVKP